MQITSRNKCPNPEICFKNHCCRNYFVFCSVRNSFFTAKVIHILFECLAKQSLQYIFEMHSNIFKIISLNLQCFSVVIHLLLTIFWFHIQEIDSHSIRALFNRCLVALTFISGQAFPVSIQEAFYLLTCPLLQREQKKKTLKDKSCRQKYILQTN